MLNNVKDICHTKYPIVLIHGTGFRDRKFFGYWGRIPKILIENGAEIYYGNQDSWGTIESNAATLKDNIEKIMEQTGAEKVNLIAHSKGGLESRYLISTLGMSDKIASLTTIATPHHGSKTMDIVYKLPKGIFIALAACINCWHRILGDENPDFHVAIKGFTTYYSKEFNEKNPDINGVYYQSYAAVMNNSLSDILMIFPHFIINLVEGENDGLVTPESANWANFKGVLKGGTNRGISHADEVDARRMKLSASTEFGIFSDICDVYVKIVSDLKDMGY